MTKPSWQDFGTYDESAFPEYWDGVVGAWCPSLGPTGGRLHDHSRFVNWGTLTNMDNATDWPISSGQYALDYDGTNDFVSIGRISAYDSTRWRTLSAWVNARSFDSPSNYNDIIGCDFIGGTREWVMAVARGPTSASGGIGCGIFGTGGGEIGAETSRIILTDQWTHLCVTQDGSYTFGGFAMYINGKPQTLTNTSSGTFTAPRVGTNALRIGIRPGPGGQDLHWNGLIDDTTIWQRALTANEVRDLYLLGRAGMYERRRRSRRRAIEQAAAFRAYWVRQKSQIIGGGV